MATIGKTRFAHFRQVLHASAQYDQARTVFHRLKKRLEMSNLCSLSWDQTVTFSDLAHGLQGSKHRDWTASRWWARWRSQSSSCHWVSASCHHLTRADSGWSRISWFSRVTLPWLRGGTSVAPWRHKSSHVPVFRRLFDRLPVRISTSDLHHRILRKKLYQIRACDFGVQFSFNLPKNHSVAATKAHCGWSWVHSGSRKASFIAGHVGILLAYTFHLVSHKLTKSYIRQSHKLNTNSSWIQNMQVLFSVSWHKKRSNSSNQRALSSFIGSLGTPTDDISPTHPTTRGQRIRLTSESRHLSSSSCASSPWHIRTAARLPRPGFPTMHQPVSDVKI